MFDDQPTPDTLGDDPEPITEDLDKEEAEEEETGLQSVMGWGEKDE